MKEEIEKLKEEIANLNVAIEAVRVNVSPRHVHG